MGLIPKKNLVAFYKMVVHLGLKGCTSKVALYFSVRFIYQFGMKATLILLNVLIVSLLNAGNPTEEARSKHKNAEAENRKKQLIQTLENSDVKLYYEEDFPGKDAPPKKMPV